MISEKQLKSRAMRLGNSVHKSVSTDKRKLFDKRYITLYHGTSPEAWEKIKREGIKPRGKAESNWKDNHQGRKDLVYLTACYPAFYATRAIGEGDTGVIVKLKIDTKKVKLYPDEEFLFFGLGMNKDKTKEEAEEAYQSIDPTQEENFYNSRDKRCVDYLDSLEFLGTVSSKYIPVDCIAEHAEVKGFQLAMDCDAGISPTNYSLCYFMYVDRLKNYNWKKYECKK